MGSPLCCMRGKDEYSDTNNDKKIKNYPQLKKAYSDPDDLKIEKIQSTVRKFLYKKKFKTFVASLKEGVIKELENKKLINEENILECESHKNYLKLIEDKKIKPFEEILENHPEYHNLISTISKYCFKIDHYIVTSPNEVYKGWWNINKKYHGHGVKYLFDDEKTINKRIEGIFLDGSLFGQGLIITSNEEIFEGTFENNKLKGNGVHHREDRSVFKGEFLNGKYNGIGNETYIDGTKFEGFFTEGEKKYGKYEWKNGSKYQGEFKNNLFHGKGIYNWHNKNTYDGNWKNGKMSGFGKYTYSDGSYYEGEFSDGKKDGPGKYIWDKDRYFEGRWKNDKENGYGTYYNKNKIIKGNWVDGKIVSSNGIIKKNKTYIIENTSKSRNETPLKKITTQELIYKKNINTEAKNYSKLNYNPTYKEKNPHYNSRNNMNLNINQFNQSSIYSMESMNSIKNNVNNQL